MNMKIATALFLTLTCVVGQSPPFSQCIASEYYTALLATKPEVITWTRDEVASLVEDTHRRYLPNVAPIQGDDDIIQALIDLYAGEMEGTVHLVYRDIDFPAVPAGSPNTWRREDLWPISRGVLRTSPALTDVHGKVPADSTVQFVKGTRFFGECGTVETADQCRIPATVETAPDTASDGKIWTPPVASRGDIARALFYTELRYKVSLGLTLTDCPPFGPTEFGYLSTLLEWHQQDPVSPEELDRNNRSCERWQGNRNPFVDYPELVSLFYGVPDTIIPGTTTFAACVEATTSPTATPNACGTLRAGDLPIYLINSDDPDQVVFYSLANIDPDIEYLYVTDNAWTGTRLLDTEGTLRFTIPEQGITVGQAFGLGPGSPFAENWEPLEGASSFELSTEGDQIFVYCLDADGVPNFLWGFSYNGPWLGAGLEQDAYGTGSSALPQSLQILGNLAVPHADNCVYAGNLAGLKSELQAEFMDPSKFTCGDTRFSIVDSTAPTLYPTPTQRCGCVDCTETILNTDARGQTCGDRIGTRVESMGVTETEACEYVASRYPLECGPACHPEKCDGQAPALCNCELCNEEVWDTIANGFTCGQRILFVLSAFGEEESCRRVAEQYPEICGTCHPVDCETSPTRAPITDRRPLPLTEIIAQIFVLQSFEAFLVSGLIIREISGEGPYSVMTPWNFAFDKLDPALSEKLQDQAWQAHLENLLRYHIYNGDVPASALEETQTLIMANGEDVVIARLPGMTSRIRVNGILVLASYDATNGFAYMLDEILRPAWLDQSLLDVASASFATLASLVVTLELESMLIDPNSSLTIFAPNNAAFIDFEQTILDYIESADGVAILEKLVLNHVVEGGPIPIEEDMFAESSVALPGGLELVLENPRRVKGAMNEATILKTNLLAHNGMIHEIDSVLLIKELPTVSPTPLPCADDRDTTFDINGTPRDCAWLETSVNYLVLLCNPYNFVATQICPETCGLCGE